MTGYSVYGVYPNGTAIASPAQPLPREAALAWGAKLYGDLVASPARSGTELPERLDVRPNPDLCAESLRWLRRLARQAGIGMIDEAAFAALRAAAEAQRQVPDFKSQTLDVALEELERLGAQGLGEWLAEAGLAEAEGSGWRLTDGPALALSIVAHGHVALLAPLFRYEISGEQVYASGLTVGPGFCEGLAAEGTRLSGHFFFPLDRVRPEWVLEQTPSGLAKVALTFEWSDVRDLHIEVAPVRAWDVAQARRATAAVAGGAGRRARRPAYVG